MHIIKRTTNLVDNNNRTTKRYNVNKMKKKVIILVLVAVFVLSGCKKQSYINDDDTIKIGLVLETMTVERWQRDRDIFVAKAKELGAEVIVKNAYEDAQLQRDIIVDMIADGVDILAIVAYDKDTLSEVVDYAHDNNVKVIAYDRIINDADVDLYISFDNVMVGEMMGQELIKNVPRGNYLILNGARTDQNAFMFNEGYMSVIQPKIDNGSINVVGETWIDAWRDELSYAYVNEAIDSGRKFDAILAANDRVSEGAINALSENRLTGEVYVTGMDAELAACQRIVEGLQGMTIYKPISVLAEGAAEIAVKMAKGEDIGPCDTIENGKYVVNYISYEPITVTKDNMVDTIIKDGFYSVEMVYANVNQSEWPEIN